MTLPPASIDLLCTFFNAAATLEPTLASLSSQTLADARFILVDDGSTDDSAAIAQVFCDQDSRFALFTNADRGRGKALNFALAQGCAPLVAILDADDLAHPTWLETACAAMDDRPDMAAISFERLMIGPGETADWTLIQPQATVLTDVTHRLGRKNQLSHSGSCIRRDAMQAVGNYALNRRSHFDYDLWVRLGAAGFRLARCAPVRIAKRYHFGQKFAWSPGYFLSTFEVQRRAIRFLSDRPATDWLFALRDLARNFAKYPLQQWAVRRRGN